MPAIGSTSVIAGSVSLESSTTPLITNLSLPTANTEVSHSLSSDLKQLMFRARNASKLQFAFTATESGTKFITVLPGVVYFEKDLDLSGKTLYVQANIASETVEILEWT